MIERTKTKIFLDSGDPLQTKKALNLLGVLDGQTTNPSLVAQNPQIQDRLSSGNKLTELELINEYQKIIKAIKKVIPQGSISIEVYADLETSTETMIRQAIEFNEWIDSPHIKLPTNNAGIQAAKILSQQGINLNMTLCFSQQQAAAVYSATKGSSKGSVFVSPFVGRLDDIGLQGMDLINNINTMYLKSDHHVELLTASVRSIKQFLYALYLGVDIITSPLKVLEEWVGIGKPIPGVDLNTVEFEDMGLYLESRHLKQMHYENVPLELEVTDYQIDHDLTTKGISKFAHDWNALLGK